MDTIEGGKWLPHQELAWTLVTTAIERVRELENEIGCFFDRNPDGTLHGKAFAGQTFDRTVHKGDLTGIEIINRLMEQVWARPASAAWRSIAPSRWFRRRTARIAGVLMIDVRTGAFRFVEAQAVLLATGGGPTMYRYHTPSGDKSMDGLAMALRAGLPLRDMEMVQFHPTGLLAGPDTRMTGTVLEEGLRGAGGYLLNGAMHRFMGDYDDSSSAPPATWSAAPSMPRCGRGAPRRMAALYIKMGHLGPAEGVRRSSRAWWSAAAIAASISPAGWSRWCRPRTTSWVAWSAAPTPRPIWPGLFVAGEDASGMHGANRLGGNGVANSTVFGGIAGDTMPRWIAANPGRRAPDEDVLEAEMARALQPFARQPGNLNALRERLLDTMWDDVGVMRDRSGPRSRHRGARRPSKAELLATGLADDDRAFNLTWHDWLNLRSLTEIEPGDRACRPPAREFAAARISATIFPEAGDLAELDASRSRGRRTAGSRSPTSRCVSPSCDRARRCSRIRPPPNRARRT